MGTTMSQEALKASRAGDHHGTGLQGLLSLWDTSSLHPAPVFQHLSWSRPAKPVVFCSFVEVGWCSKRQVKGMVCWWLTQPWCHCSSSLPTCSPSPCSRVATRLVLLLVSQKTNKKTYSSILAWLVLEIFCGFCASQAWTCLKSYQDLSVNREIPKPESNWNLPSYLNSHLTII